MLSKGENLRNKYEIKEEIEAGGMGVIYKAEDLKQGGECVIKEPRSGGSAEEDICDEKLRVEADILKRISHPNIVEYLDDFEERDNFYLVIEYLEGEPLSNLVRGSSIPPPIVKDIGVELLKALEYLHHPDRNVIHRDIKPHNLIHNLDQGKVTLIDFGTAKAGFTSIPISGATQIIAQGYSPPEQITENVDQISTAADIYSVGTTLFHLVTGENPRKHYVDGNTITGRLKPPKKVDPSVPDDLNEVIEKAVQKDVSDRFSSAQEMRRRLEGKEIEELDKARKKERQLIIGGKKYQLSDYSYSISDPLTIGREGKISIKDPKKYVSRVHCSLYEDQGGTVWIKDGLMQGERRKPSTNGTFVYTDKLGKFKSIKEWALQDGDKIALGYSEEKGPWMTMRYEE
ncbi:MAG: protein kinase domain-containing protein [Candidatus Aenigmatarchaeota archaeon]